MKKVLFICICISIICLLFSFNIKENETIKESKITQALKDCPRCGGGKFVWEEEIKTCPKCKGQKILGYEDCYGCGGTGETKTGHKCGSCEGTKKQKKHCDECMGIGTQTGSKKIVCPRCKGIGKIEV